MTDNLEKKIIEILKKPTERDPEVINFKKIDFKTSEYSDYDTQIPLTNRLCLFTDTTGIKTYIMDTETKRVIHFADKNKYRWLTKYELVSDIEHSSEDRNIYIHDLVKGQTKTIEPISKEKFVKQIVSRDHKYTAHITNNFEIILQDNKNNKLHFIADLKKINDDKASNTPYIKDIEFTDFNTLVYPVNSEKILIYDTLTKNLNIIKGNFIELNRNSIIMRSGPIFSYKMVVTNPPSTSSYEIINGVIPYLGTFLFSQNLNNVAYMNYDDKNFLASKTRRKIEDIQKSEIRSLEGFPVQWSPDNDKIAYRHKDGIWTLNLKGENQELIDKAHTFEWQPIK